MEQDLHNLKLVVNGFKAVLVFYKIKQQLHNCLYGEVFGENNLTSLVLAICNISYFNTTRESSGQRTFIAQVIKGSNLFQVTKFNYKRKKIMTFCSICKPWQIPVV